MIRTSMLCILAFASVSASAFEGGAERSSFTAELKEMATISSQTPILSVQCGPMERYDDMPEKCRQSEIFAQLSTTATIALLKEAQAVQPDALNYLAGAAPSPALYSIVEKLQVVTVEELGMEISFDEAVNKIIEAM